MSKQTPAKMAVFLDGPIGVGKTTIGKALADEMSGVFLDGDDFSCSGKPWFASSLSTSRRILEACSVSLDSNPLVIVGYPVRCLNWVFFKRHLQDMDTTLFLVGLQARAESISSPRRARMLSDGEKARSYEMARQGYGARAYSDVFIRTDENDVAACVALLKTALKTGG